MSRPILLGTERLSGGRLAWRVSVTPGHRITIVTDGVPDLDAAWAALESQIIPALLQRRRAPEGTT